jgi:hypothetical protein
MMADGAYATDAVARADDGEVARGALELSAGGIRAALAAKGVATLHYASSVSDACRYLRAGALLAPDPPGHIFLDAADVHARERRRNKCGPVLFVFHAAILGTAAACHAGVCKLPPSAWPGRTSAACWFADADEMANGFVVGNHQQMVVLRDCGGRLPFGTHLMKLIVDAPLPATAGDDSLQALRLAMIASGLAVPLKSRTCAPDCGCRTGAA